MCSSSSFVLCAVCVASMPAAALTSVKVAKRPSWDGSGLVEEWFEGSCSECSGAARLKTVPSKLPLTASSASPLSCATADASALLPVSSKPMASVTSSRIAGRYTRDRGLRASCTDHWPSLFTLLLSRSVLTGRIQEAWHELPGICLGPRGLTSILIPLQKQIEATATASRKFFTLELLTVEPPSMNSGNLFC